ncbi:MAG: hypothetical protein WAM85_11695 [Terracidiphilus sp.]
MALDAHLSAARSFAFEVEAAYLKMIQTADAGQTPTQEPGLGGKLHYTGELDGVGRVLVVAGNVAGAASLAATSDSAAQKQAIRDGVADFLVTSLDEALRILKNEIRKRETVAVCVGEAPEAVEREMRERGVLPDLLRPGEASPPHYGGTSSEGTPDVATDPMRIPALVTWSVASAPAQWLPELDAIALECLEPEAWIARRWVRLAPRYLGRLARGAHSLHLDREFGARFIDRVREQVERGKIRVPVEIQLTCRGGSEQHRLSPPGNPESVG